MPLNETPSLDEQSREHSYQQNFKQTINQIFSNLERCEISWPGTHSWIHTHLYESPEMRLVQAILRLYFLDISYRSQRNDTFRNEPQQTADIFLVMDLESTCGNCDEPSVYPIEIIEIPVFSVDAKSLSVVGCFHSYVRPINNPILTKFCRHLTGIPQSCINNARTFPGVWTSLLTKIQEWTHNGKLNASFVTYGNSDVSSLLINQLQQCKLLIPPLLDKWINLIQTWMDEYSYSPGTLTNLCCMLGVDFVGQAHSGYYDTLNTVEILRQLTDRGIRLVVNAGKITRQIHKGLDSASWKWVRDESPTQEMEMALLQCRSLLGSVSPLTIADLVCAKRWTGENMQCFLQNTCAVPLSIQFAVPNDPVIGARWRLLHSLGRHERSITSSSQTRFVCSWCPSTFLTYRAWLKRYFTHVPSRRLYQISSTLVPRDERAVFSAFTEGERKDVLLSFDSENMSDFTCQFFCNSEGDRCGSIAYAKTECGLPACLRHLRQNRKKKCYQCIADRCPVCLDCIKPDVLALHKYRIVPPKISDNLPCSLPSRNLFENIEEHKTPRRQSHVHEGPVDHILLEKQVLALSINACCRSKYSTFERCCARDKDGSQCVFSACSQITQDGLVTTGDGKTKCGVPMCLLHHRTRLVYDVSRCPSGMCPRCVKPQSPLGKHWISKGYDDHDNPTIKLSSLLVSDFAFEDFQEMVKGHSCFESHRTSEMMMKKLFVKIETLAKKGNLSGSASFELYKRAMSNEVDAQSEIRRIRHEAAIECGNFVCESVHEDLNELTDALSDVNNHHDISVMNVCARGRMTGKFWYQPVVAGPRHIMTVFFDKNGRVLHRRVDFFAKVTKKLPWSLQNLWSEVYRRKTYDLRTNELLEVRDDDMSFQKNEIPEQKTCRRGRRKLRKRAAK